MSFQSEAKLTWESHHFASFTGGQAQNSSQIRLLNQHLDDRELEDLAMMRYASYYGQRPGL